MWLEDMLLPGNFDQYRELAMATSLPLTTSERMAGKMQFEQILDARAAKFVMFDVTWCGGLTEARKIAALADAYSCRWRRTPPADRCYFYAATHLTGRRCSKTRSLLRMAPSVSQRAPVAG